MITPEQFEAAFRTPSPWQALLDLILAAVAAGETRAEIYHQFETIMLRLQEAGPGRDNDLTVLMDAMDALCGWGPAVKDFPFNDLWNPERDCPDTVAR
jgi:hypothetical protein